MFLIFPPFSDSAIPLNDHPQRYTHPHKETHAAWLVPAGTINPKPCSFDFWLNFFVDASKVIWFARFFCCFLEAHLLGEAFFFNKKAPVVDSSTRQIQVYLDATCECTLVNRSYQMEWNVEHWNDPNSIGGAVVIYCSQMDFDGHMHALPIEYWCWPWQTSRII